MSCGNPPRPGRTPNAGQRTIGPKPPAAPFFFSMDTALEDFVTRLGAALAALVEALVAFLMQPSVIAEVVAIAALAGLALVIGRRVEARFERKVRRIHGDPRLIRLAAILLRRTPAMVAAALLWAAALAARILAMPPAGELLMIAAWLTTAWAAISVLARLVRNRTLGRLLAYAAWTLIALQITGLWGDVRIALAQAAIDVGETRVSALFILEAILVSTIAIWLAFAAGRVIEAWLARNRDLTPGLRVLLGKLGRIALLALASLVALTAIGIDITALAVFGGALGVGLGFGLQKVVSNYLSGIIILADKSIKPGDIVSLGEKVGLVRSIRARFVSVVTRDGVEFLIPNEDFVTNRVVNWSFTDNLVRVDVTFGVSYDSDPHLVRRLAVETALATPRVEQRPEPVCHMEAFGDSSLDFLLRFWIADPHQGLANVRGAVLIGLWDAFKAAGVKIPYPHRDVLLRRAPPSAGPGGS